MATEQNAADPATESEIAKEKEPEIVELWDEPDVPEGAAVTPTENAPAEDGEAERGKGPEEFGREGLPLKYLGFVPEVIWQAWVIILWLHGTVKGWLGPLKRVVDKLEEIAKPFVVRVYRIVNVYANPKAILLNVDSKVDGVVKLLNRILPEFVSQGFSRAYNSCSKVVARICCEGPKPSAMSFYNKYSPVFEAYAVWAYKSAIRIPLMPTFFAVARYFAVTVNKAIMFVKQCGLPLTGYLPPLPVDYFDQLSRSD